MKKIILLLLLVVLALGVYVATFDVNDYRQEIASVLSSKLARKVELKDKIHMTFSWADGFALEIGDVVIGNPAWASRPNMAHVGKLTLRVALKPLLQKKIEVIALNIDQAKVQLETNKKGQSNWDFKNSSQFSSPSSRKEANSDDVASQSQADRSSVLNDKGNKSKRVSLKVQKAQISNSHFGYKGKGGKLIIFDVPQLTFKDNGTDVYLHFLDALGDVPTEIELAGVPLDKLGKGSWPFNMEGRFGDHSFTAQGAVGGKIKTFTLSKLALEKDKSKITGHMSVILSGARPVIKGRLKSHRLSSSFFQFASAVESVEQDKKTAKQTKKTKKKLFSKSQLDLERLKKVTLDLAFQVDKWIVGPVLVQDVYAKVSLDNGVLKIAPLSALVGGAKAHGSLMFNAASSRAHIAVDFAAKRVELAKLIDFSGADTVLSGKTDLDFSLKSNGSSYYDLASRAQGHMNLVMDSESKTTNALTGLATQILNFVAPSIGSIFQVGVNCVAARYQMKNGLIETKDFLLDAKTTTIAGSGIINLPDEHINIRFRAKPKAIGIFVPSVKLYGDLRSPRYTIDGQSAVSQVTRLFTSQKTVHADIPNVVPIKGKNACLFALDNPKNMAVLKTQSLPQKTLIPSSSKIDGAIKDIGNKLMNIFGNGLFAPAQ